MQLSYNPNLSLASTAGGHGSRPARHLSAIRGRTLRGHRKDIMELTVLEGLAPSERDQIERWRTGELERAGFDVALARTLAARIDVDLHRAVEMIDAGCRPELAARILL